MPFPESVAGARFKFAVSYGKAGAGTGGAVRITSHTRVSFQGLSRGRRGIDLRYNLAVALWNGEFFQICH